MSLQDEINEARADTRPGQGMTSLMSGIGDLGLTGPLRPTIPEQREATFAEAVKEAERLLAEPVPVPRCHCGEPVCPDLLAIRDLFPALSPNLCTRHSAEAEAQEEESEKAAQEAIEHRERLARLTKIPPEILETSTSHVAFNVPLWVSVCDWHPDKGRWLLIHGLPGRCKTRVVGLLAKKLILDGWRVSWAPACDMGDLVRDTRSHDRTLYEPARAALREWKAAELLVIDDLGKNLWNPDLEAKLFEIIDHRKTWKKPTILTCNEPLPEMLRLKKISMERGAPLVSRVLEAARGWTFEAPEIQRRTNAGRGEAA